MHIAPTDEVAAWDCCAGASALLATTAYQGGNTAVAPGQPLQPIVGCLPVRVFVRHREERLCKSQAEAHDAERCEQRPIQPGVQSRNHRASRAPPLWTKV